jgi:hypothetical protein
VPYCGHRACGSSVRRILFWAFLVSFTRSKIDQRRGDHKQKHPPKEWVQYYVRGRDFYQAEYFENKKKCTCGYKVFKEADNAFSKCFAAFFALLPAVESFAGNARAGERFRHKKTSMFSVLTPMAWRSVGKVSIKKRQETRTFSSPAPHRSFITTNSKTEVNNYLFRVTEISFGDCSTRISVFSNNLSTTSCDGISDSFAKYSSKLSFSASLKISVPTASFLFLYSSSPTLEFITL